VHINASAFRRVSYRCNFFGGALQYAFKRIVTRVRGGYFGEKRVVIRSTIYFIVETKTGPTDGTGATCFGERAQRDRMFASNEAFAIRSR
jgi:hypothetical protein